MFLSAWWREEKTIDDMTGLEQSDEELELDQNVE